MKKEIRILAPARTCLFGDHQDYLGLPVIACAVDRYIKLTAIKNEGNFFYIKLPDINEDRTIYFDDVNKPLKEGDYFISTLKVLKRYGCFPSTGYEVVVSGNIPVNAGISSSSALVVSWVTFLLEAFGSTHTVTKELVSKIAYEAEVLEHKASGGKMDQYSIGIGNVIYLETGDHLNYEVINKKIEGLIVGESGIAKKTNEVLHDLKVKAWNAIHTVKETDNTFSIEKAKIDDLSNYIKQLPDQLSPYFYAAVTNHNITQSALTELKKDSINYKKVGALMNEHHTILRDVLKITIPKIDCMIDAALSSGAYGAKIVGSGKGGSIVAIAPKGKEQNVINAILKAGAKDAYKVNVDSGARVIDNAVALP